MTSLGCTLHRHATPDRPYWKSPHGDAASKVLVFECDQWRHGNEQRAIEGRFHLQPDQETASGVLRCRIEAENLSTAAKKQVRVRISVERQSGVGPAARAVDALIKGAESS
jgi:hypothetical protein